MTKNAEESALILSNILSAIIKSRPIILKRKNNALNKKRVLIFIIAVIN